MGDGTATISKKQKPKEDNSAVIPERRYSVTCDDIAKMPEVKAIFARKGKYPDIIVIGWAHPVQNKSMDIISKEKEIRESLSNVGSMCNKLYFEYNVPSIMIEGVPPISEEEYRQIGRIDMARGPENSKLDLETVSWMETIVNTRKWELRSGESGQREENEMKSKDLDAIYAEFSSKSGEIIAEALTKTGVDPNTLKYDEKKFQANFNEVYARELAKYKKKIETILTPKRLDELYREAVTEREERYLDKCEQLLSENKGPVIVIIGNSHLKSLSEKIGKRHNFISVLSFVTDSKLVTEVDKKALKISLLQKLEGSVTFNFTLFKGKDGGVQVQLNK